MRLSFILATFATGLSVVYRSFIKEHDGEQFGRNVIKSAAYLVFIGILGLIPALTTLVDIFNYMFVVVVVLNDGYDILQSIGGL